MGERSDEIEEQISRTREDLRDNLNELEDRVRGALDWRRQFEERPLTMLGAALGGGMLLAALLPGGGNGRRRTAYAEASTRSKGRREAEARARETEPESDGSLHTWKGTFMTVAASRIGGFLGQLLAGYHAETARAKRAQRYSAR